MKRGLTAALFATVALVPGMSMAQDVVMRRPLTQSASGQATPTPTPTPSPSVPGQGPAHGWDVDCSTGGGTAQCMDIDETGDAEPVDAAGCSGTQTPAQESWAHEHGYFGLDDGVSSGSTGGICTGTTPAGKTFVYEGSSYCASQDGNAHDTDVGKVASYCTGYVFAGNYSAGAQPIFYGSVDNARCASQPHNAAWDGVNQDYMGGSAVPPERFGATDGQTCSANSYRTISGALCGDDGNYQCKAVTYYWDGTTYSNVDVEDAPAVSCYGGDSYSGRDIDFLSQIGLSPVFTSNTGATCAKPDVYGATGQCVSKVTYDTGWPTPPASAHVTTGYQAQCYAVYHADDPNKIQAVEVGITACQNNPPTAEQRAILARLSPALQAYSDLDQTCKGNGGVDVNYQRQDFSLEQPMYADDQGPFGSFEDVQDASDEVLAHASSAPDTVIIANDPFNDRVRTRHYAYRAVAVLPYVCTDVPAGTYFDGSDIDNKSTYPMSDPVCAGAHQSDLQAVQSMADQITADCRAMVDPADAGSCTAEVVDIPDHQEIAVYALGVQIDYPDYPAWLP